MAENRTHRWQFPSGCSRCNGNEAHTTCRVVGEHEETTLHLIVYRRYRVVSYFAYVPICRDCEKDLTKPRFRAHAYFRSEGTELRFRNKDYQRRYDKHTQAIPDDGLEGIRVWTEQEREQARREKEEDPVKFFQARLEELRATEAAIEKFRKND